jgi:polyhydroxyalkanoate synthase subunit PhaC
MSLAEKKTIVAEPPEEAAPILDAFLGANPFVELNLNEIVEAYTDLATSLLAQPERLWSTFTRLSADLLSIALGGMALQPEPNDRRFTDPAWEENPFYRRLKQTYLAGRAAAYGLLGPAANDGPDWKASARRRFALQLLVEAFAPTNALASNPAALKRVLETGGQNLFHGLRNFIDDLWHNGGMPAQVDKRPFKVGETIATTPGAVIWRSELCELIQYSPSTKQVRERPLLLVPPQINKFYVMDLAPHRSLTEYAVGRGIQFFTLSWRNAGPADRDKGLDDYVTAIEQASSVVREVTGSPDLNLLAVCAGGMTSALATAHLTAIGDQRVNSATLLVTMLDSGSSSMVGMFATEEMISGACRGSREKGILDAAAIGRLFAWLRPNDLIWNYWVNNYLMGKDPAPFDILFWNGDGTNLPAALHAGFLDLLVRNPLLEAGKFKVLGTPINLRAVTHDLYVVSGQTDHICSWRAGHRAAGLFGGKAEFVLNSSGHVQSLVCPPGNFKARYFTNPHLEATPERWLASAIEHKGSWWDHWLAWLEPRSGELRRAPEELGASQYPALDPAPGTYVLQTP